MQRLLFFVRVQWLKGHQEQVPDRLISFLPEVFNAKLNMLNINRSTGFKNPVPEGEYISIVRVSQFTLRSVVHFMPSRSGKDITSIVINKIGNFKVGMLEEDQQKIKGEVNHKANSADAEQ